MAAQEPLDILKHGVDAWNTWRKENPSCKPNLSRRNLQGLNFEGGDFHKVDFYKSNLSRANLKETNFRRAYLSRANLTEALLSDTNFEGASLFKADLSYADLSLGHFYEANLLEANLRKASLFNTSLREVDLTEADLTEADLSGAILSGAKFYASVLQNTNFLYSRLSRTIFARCNLITAQNLEHCIHNAPSILDHQTLGLSQNLPLAFLRGCGLPENLIVYLPSLFGQTFQYYSCFISYSSKDQEFTDRLYADLQNKGVRCWYASEEMKAGQKLHDQIDTAIRLHDKLLLVLSEHSLKSDWVTNEIRRCRRSEQREQKRKLFPIRLVDMPNLQDWTCPDADSGKDLAVETREYFIPDFSNWKDHDSYKKAFDRLLRDLKESAIEEG